MRRTSFLLLALLILVLIQGCGTDDSNSEGTSETRVATLSEMYSIDSDNDAIEVLRFVVDSSSNFTASFIYTVDGIPEYFQFEGLVNPSGQILVEKAGFKLQGQIDSESQKITLELVSVPTDFELRDHLQANPESYTGTYVINVDYLPTGSPLSTIDTGPVPVGDIIPDCWTDDDCGHNQDCILFYCWDTEGIGETCQPWTPTCRDDLICRPDPVNPVALWRCFPVAVSAINFDNEDECRRLYSPVAHQDNRTYFEGSQASTFAKASNATVGYSGILERGAIYSEDGQYGCYETICGGATVGAEVGTAFSTSDVFEFRHFEGDSSVTSLGVGFLDVPGVGGLSYVFSEIYSVLNTEHYGRSYALAAELGVDPPMQLGQYACRTKLNAIMGPPTANAGPDQFLECTSPEGALVTLDGTASFDPDGGEIQEYEWNGFFGTVFGPTPTIPFPITTETVSLVVVDDEGISSTEDQAIVTVQDTTGPETHLQAIPDVLWPPNNKMVNVNILVDVDDVCDPEPLCIIENVTSNEQENRPEVDWEIMENFSLQLRAQRDGQGFGRSYSVTVACEDFYGNVTKEIVDVSVPHDQSN